MEEVASIIIHLDCYDAIKCLPDELAGILFKSILCYGSTGELPKIDDKSLLALFNMFKAQRDRDKKKIRTEMRKESRECTQEIFFPKRDSTVGYHRKQSHAVAGERMHK